MQFSEITMEELCLATYTRKIISHLSQHTKTQLTSRVHTASSTHTQTRTPNIQVHSVLSESWPLNMVSYFCSLLIHSRRLPQVGALPSLAFPSLWNCSWHTHSPNTLWVMHTNTHDSWVLAWRSLSHSQSVCLISALPLNN